MSANKNNSKRVLIGGAWPYANGPLHLGHIAALLPGDILARYFRMTGAKVLYVSGSDCHGTPISMRADEEGVSPQVISDRYHESFVEVFGNLGFSYDVYTKTSSDFHKKLVQKFFLKLYEKGLLYRKAEKMAYCTSCKRFLPDRYVVGTCYTCGAATRGDQCDACGTIIEVDKLKDIKCNICASKPEIRETEHLVFSLSKFQDRIEKLVNDNADIWRKNAVSLSRRYIKESLQDRAATRDLDWGVDVPLDGFDGKKIYVWIEAVLGYVTASAKWFDDNGIFDEWEDFWKEGLVSYYVHGKDNIPFHSIILPGLLMGLDFEGLPSYITSSEYLTIEGKKLSTSKNWAIWADDYLTRYDPDPLRYFLTVNGPETKDSDFSWREFVERNNGELLGAYGNLVNRTMSMTIKNFGKVVPDAIDLKPEDIEILEKCKGLYATVGNYIENGEFKKALEEVFDAARSTNKYIDTQAPWTTAATDKARTGTVLKVCLDAILNISSLAYPFIPFTAEKALAFLNRKPEWNYSELKSGSPINEPEILVKKLDKSIIEEEVSRLGN